MLSWTTDARRHHTSFETRAKRSVAAGDTGTLNSYTGLGMVEADRLANNHPIPLSSYLFRCFTWCNSSSVFLISFAIHKCGWRSLVRMQTRVYSSEEFNHTHNMSAQLEHRPAIHPMIRSRNVLLPLVGIEHYVLRALSSSQWSRMREHSLFHDKHRRTVHPIKRL